MSPSEWDGKKVWQEVFHPEVMAGIAQAEAILAANALARLDRQLDEPTCATSSCEWEATVAVYCRHTGDLLTLRCGRCAEILRHSSKAGTCRSCRRVMPIRLLVSTRPIFTRRSTS